jgi:D-aminopeptidase
LNLDGSLRGRLESAVAALARTYAGPGGACAVLREGEVLVRHAWGWANVEQRIRFTPRSLFRICSITKQFTCGVVLETCPQPQELDAAVRDCLPRLEGAAPTALQLCHNQSGLRDYWAVAMLHGSPVEAPFGEHEAQRLIAGTRSLQFVPGTRYSYVNQNFRLLADIVQARTGRGFEELLRRYLFDPAGMADARLIANTRAMPDGTEGYEGSQFAGFRPAVNRVLWTGDAGIGASLDDLIAWERSIDAARDDADAIYARLSAPVCFADGMAATYGFGLSRQRELGHVATGHGGALRGWRSHRLYLPAKRVSVVVLFNHLSDAHGAAVDLVAALLGIDRPAPTEALSPPLWLGAYREPETELAVRVDLAADGRLRLRYGHAAERLELHADGSAGNGATRLTPGNGGLWMERPAENQRSLLESCGGGMRLDVAGRYRCAELDAELTVVDAGGALYGAFSGFLGPGRMEVLEPIGSDVWALPCPRALDHTPPGDWTLRFRRDAGGQASSAIVGCWLARGLTYERLD